jgi:hypothetical protein
MASDLLQIFKFGLSTHRQASDRARLADSDDTSLSNLNRDDVSGMTGLPFA